VVAGAGETTEELRARGVFAAKALDLDAARLRCQQIQ
jgi:hypothetical protein